MATFSRHFPLINQQSNTNNIMINAQTLHVSLPRSFYRQEANIETDDKGVGRPDPNVLSFFGKSLIPIDSDRPIFEQIMGTDLDFQLQLRPVYRNLGSMGITFGEHNFESCDRYRFLINDRTNEVFDIVGKNWTPHQVEDTLTTFQDWCNETGLNMTHVGQLDGGKVVYALADYPDVIEFGQDTTIAKVLLSNFNKLGFSTRIDLFTYRLVCQNGLTVKSQVNSTRLNHTNDLVQSDRLTNALDNLHKNFAKHKEQMRSLTQVTMTKAEAQMLLIKSFGNIDKDIDDQPRIVQTCLSLFDGKAKGSEFLSAYNTAYGLLQSCTEYLTHHSRKTSTHLSSVLYGSKQSQAEKLIQSLVKNYL